MPDPDPGHQAPDPRKVHGHTGPTTPAEEAARESPVIPPHEAAKVAENASREEDA